MRLPFRFTPAAPAIQTQLVWGGMERELSEPDAAGSADHVHPGADPRRVVRTLSGTNLCIEAACVREGAVDVAPVRMSRWGGPFELPLELAAEGPSSLWQVARTGPALALLEPTCGARAHEFDRAREIGEPVRVRLALGIGRGGTRPFPGNASMSLGFSANELRSIAARATDLSTVVFPRILVGGSCRTGSPANQMAVAT